MSQDLFRPAANIITLKDRLNDSLTVMVGGGWAEAVLCQSGYGFREWGFHVPFVIVWVAFANILWCRWTSVWDLPFNGCAVIAFGFMAEIIRGVTAVIILDIVLPVGRGFWLALSGVGS